MTTKTLTYQEQLAAVVKYQMEQLAAAAMSAAEYAAKVAAVERWHAYQAAHGTQRYL